VDLALIWSPDATQPEKNGQLTQFGSLIGHALLPPDPDAHQILLRSVMTRVHPVADHNAVRLLGWLIEYQWTDRTLSLEEETRRIGTVFDK
jgi:hypothetical protein